MAQLILGLVLFFGIHSVSIVALPLRDSFAAKSELGWKAFYAIASLVGIILVVRGYAELRSAPTILYVSPVWLRHVAAVFLLPIFVLFLAPYFPGRITAAVKHPQLVAVKLWSVAHLLVNGTVADVLLFWSFLVWGVADTIS
ncbi:MAG: NnrU family protein, partial [Deltaproteobacteria bacterium]|nr:NnrU family protein [Deltaproteobacteria bacterium]